MSKTRCNRTSFAGVRRWVVEGGRNGDDCGVDSDKVCALGVLGIVDDDGSSVVPCISRSRFS